MKSPTSRLARYGLVILAVFAGLALFGAEATDLLTPTKRAELLAQATKMQQMKAAEIDAPNPFYPPSFGAASSLPKSNIPAVGEPKGALQGQALLQAISASLKPSGYMVIGGQQSLNFGQKRVKAGGLLTITFEGKEYILELVAINRTHFTLRLDREEFTRSIK